MWLNAEQLERLLEGCEAWFRPFVMIAAMTGAPRAPLLRVRDVQVAYRQDLNLRTATLFLINRLA